LTESLVEANGHTRPSFTYYDFDDSLLFKAFARGRTDGIFQFEKPGAKQLLRQVKPANIHELIACNSLNRPAPIQLGMVDEYVAGKNGEAQKKTKWSQYLEDTYGTIIYQEQVMTICRELAHMEWGDIDKVMKNLKPQDNKVDELEIKFVKGAMEYSGFTEPEAKHLYQTMTKYLFNRGHATAYTMTSLYAMKLFISYPLEYCAALISLEGDEVKVREYQELAASRGIIILPPHVNGGPVTRIETFEDEQVIRLGLNTLKGIGQKTAENLCAMGPFHSIGDIEALPKRVCNSKVKGVLIASGALEFDEYKIVRRIAKFNGGLRSRFERMQKKGELMNGRSKRPATT
jgi:DNA polymerase-3 subunit alpha